MRLFETEIPEIAEGIVQVARPPPASRESAPRSPWPSTKRDVDPIGACVGLRGTRIQVISRELRGEKIDIVEWSPDPATFVARALSPAKVARVTVGEPDAEGGQPSVLVIVPDNQLSLAIGKRGQNARLAAKLTGLRVDIKSEGEVEEERRRDEEELAHGRQGLATFPGVGPQLIERLVEHGLFSPARIVRADFAALAAVPVSAREARALLAAAQEWIEQHPAVIPARSSRGIARENCDGGAGESSGDDELPATVKSRRLHRRRGSDARARPADLHRVPEDSGQGRSHPAGARRGWAGEGRSGRRGSRTRGVCLRQ